MRRPGERTGSQPSRVIVFALPLSRSTVATVVPRRFVTVASRVPSGANDAGTISRLRCHGVRGCGLRPSAGIAQTAAAITGGPSSRPRAQGRSKWPRINFKALTTRSPPGLKIGCSWKKTRGARWMELPEQMRIRAVGAGQENAERSSGAARERERLAVRAPDRSAVVVGSEVRLGTPDRAHLRFAGGSHRLHFRAGSRVDVEDVHRQPRTGRR